MIGRSDKPGIRIYYCRNAGDGMGALRDLVGLGNTPGVTVEPVPCGGRIDPRYLLKAYESGADAVCVLTCPAHHCRLMEGNLRAGRRVNAVRELIAEAGLDPSSLQVFMPDGPGEEEFAAAVRELAAFVSDRQRLAEMVVA